MKTINELVADCNSAVKDYIEMQKEDEKLRADLTEVVLKNWQIVKSSVADFEQIRKMLVSCFGRSNKSLGSVVCHYGKGISISIGSVNSYWIEKVEVSLFDGTNRIDCVKEDYWNKDNPFNASYITEWAMLLGTEEDANKLVENISQYYIKAMEYYLEEIIPQENARMRESIENVKDLLSNSHTVEEKEDGTVEIRLGGKTYVGTLKEE